MPEGNYSQSDILELLDQVYSESLQFSEQKGHYEVLLFGDGTGVVEYGDGTATFFETTSPSDELITQFRNDRDRFQAERENASRESNRTEIVPTELDKLKQSHGILSDRVAGYEAWVSKVWRVVKLLIPILLPFAIWLMHLWSEKLVLEISNKVLEQHIQMVKQDESRITKLEVEQEKLKEKNSQLEKQASELEDLKIKQKCSNNNPNPTPSWPR